MPTLPDKFALGGAPGVASRPLALVNDMPNGDGSGIVAGEIAKGVGKLAGALQAKQEEADDYEVQKQLVEFDLAQEKRLDDAKRNARPEAKDFTTSYRGGYDEGARSLMQRVPERLKPKVDEALVKRGAAFEKRAYDFELAERDRWNVQDVNKQVSDLITHTMGNPDVMDDNASRGVAIVRASKLSVRAKIDAERKFLDANAEYGLKAQIDREIEAGRDASDIISRLRKVPKGSMGPPVERVRQWNEAGPVEEAGSVGAVSAKYESGGRGVNMVSSGKGDPGGVSYGAHQLSTKDSMPAFLNSEEGARYAEKFANLRVGSPEFNKVYKETAASDPQGFGKAQYDFYRRTHYEPVLAHAKAKGLDVNDRGVQEALFSISVQHGGAKSIIDTAMDEIKGKGAAAQVKALYGARYNYVDNLRSLPKGTKSSVLDRYDREVGDALALVGTSGGGAVGLAKTGGAVGAGGDGTNASVERATLPDVATEEDRRLKTDTETGQTTVSNDVGDTKADIPGAPKPGEPVGQNDELVEDDQPGWSYLSPATRRKLINYARTAGRAMVTKGVDDDIARLRLGREPVVGEDGKTSLQRARAHMTNMQWTKKSQEWAAAGLEHQEISGLRTMTDSEMGDYKSSIVDRAEAAGLSVADAARIQKKADTISAKIMEMRNKDPVRAITGSIGDEPDDRTPPLPHTADAIKALKENRGRQAQTGPDGAPVLGQGPQGRVPRISDDEEPASAMPGRIGRAPIPARDQWGILFEARLKDQEMVMPYNSEKHRIISKAEAEQLLMIPRKAKETGDRKGFETALKEGWERAQKKFPPEYADRAFKEAINFAIDGDIDGVKASILSKLAKGRPVTGADLRQLRGIEETDRTSVAEVIKSGGLETMQRFDRLGRDRGPGPGPLPSIDPALPAIATMPQTVTQGDVARGRVTQSSKAKPKDMSPFERATRWFTNAE